MSVTCLFSPNRLIDYSPAICIRLLTSTRYLRMFVKQTRNLRPTPMSFFEKPPLLDYQLEAEARLGIAKNETRGLSSSSITNLLSLYGKNTFNIPTLPSERYLQNMPLLPFSFSRFSVSRCGVSTNTGTTACLHCSCLSCLNAHSCGSVYVRWRRSARCRLSRIRYNVIMMENGSWSRLIDFFQEMLWH